MCCVYVCDPQVCAGISVVCVICKRVQISTWCVICKCVQISMWCVICKREQLIVMRARLLAFADLSEVCVSASVCRHQHGERFKKCKDEGSLEM
jgi:hypothetical protein